MLTPSALVKAYREGTNWDEKMDVRTLTTTMQTYIANEIVTGFHADLMRVVMSITNDFLKMPKESRY